ncbi:APC family permease [Candidatus Woesearchaeota archaeon]|nr:APC family permease [Candidatus Woesearchaeota archaeon]
MTRLKRVVGLAGLLAAGIGTILGARIYALVGKAAAFSGNSLWIAFVISAVIAMFTGLSFAELSSKFPKAGGPYYYAWRIFNRKVGFFVGLGMIVAGILVSVTLCLAFGGYVSSLIPVPAILSAIALIAIVAAINYLGVKEAIGFNFVATLIELAGLIIIIALGVKFFGSANYFEFPSDGFVGILGAVGVIFFAYLGFEDVVNLAEETKHAKKLVPLAVILSVVITTIVYVLVAVAAVSVVPAEVLAQSDAPLTLVFRTATNMPAGYLFSVIALVSIFNTILLMFLATTRIVYSMGRDKALPRIFSKLHEKRKIPHISIFALSVVVFFLIFIKNITLVAQLTDIVILAVFVVINLAVIKLRYSDIDEKGFTIPFNIGKFPLVPFLGVLTSLAILIVTVLHVVGIY